MIQETNNKKIIRRESLQNSYPEVFQKSERVMQAGPTGTAQLAGELSSKAQSESYGITQLTPHFVHFFT